MNFAASIWEKTKVQLKNWLFGELSPFRCSSMLTEECELRPYLERRGIAVIETDLGERIQQLDDEPPSHVVVPAVHKLRGDVAKVFARTLNTAPDV